MINHGLSTGALFLMVGMLYERTHKRGLSDFGGLADRAPLLTFFFGFVLMSSIGLPGLNGFVSEALSLLGAIQAFPALAAAAVFGAVLAAAYGLPAFQAVFWRPEGTGSVSAKVTALTRKERGLLWTFAALILGLGLYPGPVLSILRPSLEQVLK
jgi:NADH-quinone oxidoreductase subunit M